jgi:hypothetical protein
MKHIVVVACGAVLATAGCATAASDDGAISERAAERLAQFEATGETENCLSVMRIQSITALDERHLLVRVSTNNYYLNKVSGKCNGAQWAGNRLQYTITTGQLCRNEIITVVDNTTGLTEGSCGLNSFEKLERIEAR